MSRVEHRDQIPRAYFWGAVAATIAVLSAPGAFLLVTGDVRRGISPSLVAGGVLVALLVGLVGSALWRLSPHSRTISFGELMLWRWARRRRAEEVIERNVKRIGVDRTGRRAVRGLVTPVDQLRMLQQLIHSLEVKDPYTRRHSARVERLCFQTALILGLDGEDVEVLRRAASVHDVGKIRISAEVLRKPGLLTAEERKEIEKHSVVGARMVEGLGEERVVAAVRHHHERWDGKGYPDGLTGAQIPLFARVIAVADTYDAISSTRAYRPRASSARAREIIREEAGAQFDPEVVEAFLSTFADRRSLVGGFAGILSHPSFLRLIDWTERAGAGSLAPAVASAVAVATLAPAALAPWVPPADAARPGKLSAPPAALAPSEGDVLQTVPWGGTIAAEAEFASALRTSGARTNVAGKVVRRKGRGSDTRRVAGTPAVARQAAVP